MAYAEIHAMNNSVNPDDFLDLATFDGERGAEKLRAALAVRGINARLKNEKNLQRFWFMAPAKASVHVQVERRHLDDAEQILQSGTLGEMKGLIRCPSCGSTRVQYPALSRKNILPGFVGWLLAVLHFQHHKYFCESCQYTWPQPRPDATPRDALQWPVK